MTRTEAMKEAQKRYRAKKGSAARTTKSLGIELPIKDFEYATKVISQSKMTKAEFLRWAVGAFNELNEHEKDIAQMRAKFQKKIDALYEKLVEICDENGIAGFTYAHKRELGISKIDLLSATMRLTQDGLIKHESFDQENGISYIRVIAANKGGAK